MEINEKEFEQLMKNKPTGSALKGVLLGWFLTLLTVIITVGLVVFIMYSTPRCCDNSRTILLLRYDKVQKPIILNRYLSDTIRLFNTEYIYNTDTIYQSCDCESLVDTIELFVKNTDQPRLEKSRWSVFSDLGCGWHQMVEDGSWSKNRPSFGAEVGVAYNHTENLRSQLTLDYYSAFLRGYRPNYVGIDYTINYDVLKDSLNHLYLGSGLGYSHSFNKRKTTTNTIENIYYNGELVDTENSSVIDIKRIDTDNLVIPFKVEYEYDITDDWSIGAYTKLRWNVIRLQWSTPVEVDAGIHARKYL